MSILTQSRQEPQETEVWRCSVCGHRFTPSAFDAHRGAFPLNHPLRRCLDGQELTALGFIRHRDGTWALAAATECRPAQIQRLPTIRSEVEHWDLTGEVLAQPRFAAPRSATKSLNETRTALLAAKKRAQTRRRVQRFRALHVTRKQAPLPLAEGCVTSAFQVTDSEGRKTRLLPDPRSASAGHSP